MTAADRWLCEVGADDTELEAVEADRFWDWAIMELLVQ
jgi:hypothetical protein